MANQLPKKFEKITSLEEWGKATKFLADNKCELTGVIGGNHSHHCYDKSTYPERAFDLENCLVLSGYLHMELFHKQFMGGTDKTTTPGDLIKWVNTLSDDIAPKENKAKVIKKLRALIKKYTTSKVANKTCSKVKTPSQAMQIKYIDRPPKKRTKNGDYIHEKTKIRYSNREKDQIHNNLRLVKKQLKKAQTSHRFFKIFTMVCFGCLLILVLVMACSTNNKIVYKNREYTYIYANGKKIWFDRFDVQMDKKPRPNYIPQLGRDNQEW